MNGGCKRDLVGGWSAFVFWGLPTLAIALGAFAPSLRSVLWVPSFVVMGAACVVNARGCGRLHCYVTGPLFLLAALVIALGVLDWTLVLVIVAVGTALAYGVEWMRGKYVGSSSTLP